MRIIEFYRNIDGGSPIEDFLDNLTSKQSQKVAWTLLFIKEQKIIPKIYFKKLDGTKDLWEIRVQAANEKIRILCFFQKNNLILLTNCFFKKSQKVPLNEIKLAEKRIKDYNQRISNG